MFVVTDLGGVRDARPPQSNFFHFHAVSGKIMPTNRLAPPSPTGLAPSLLEILDTSLVRLVCLSEGFTAFVPESLFTRLTALPSPALNIRLTRRFISGRSATHNMQDAQHATKTSTV